METLIKIGKNAVKYFLLPVVALAFIWLLMVLYLWLVGGLILLLMVFMIDGTPLALLGIIFVFAALFIIHLPQKDK